LVISRAYTQLLYGFEKWPKYMEVLLLATSLFLSNWYDYDGKINFSNMAVSSFWKLGVLDTHYNSYIFEKQVLHSALGLYPTSSKQLVYIALLQASKTFIYVSIYPMCFLAEFG
jgi:hypothetical protein